MVNIVLFFAHAFIQWWTDVQCMQAQRTNPMGHRGSYTETKCTYKGLIVWAYGATMHVQKNNPIGTRGTCVTKDQPYGDQMHK